MTPNRIVWKSEELQFCIAAASSASRHAAILHMVHYGPSQVHYSLNTVIKLFPINHTTSVTQLYDQMILERQLLLYKSLYK